MKIYAPEYYGKFKCIAEKCRHNCCIGWEIDIDENTLRKYKGLTDGFGRTICEHIQYDCETAYFKLGENDRCPFLNKDNLCDIIINLGYDAICDICAEHPRFRNFYSDFSEVGLGLCCEAAAEIILSEEKPFSLECIEENGDAFELYSEFESEFFELRNRCIGILTNRSLSLDKRFAEFSATCKSRLPQKSIAKWVDIFSDLEEMDPHRSEILEDIRMNVKTVDFDMHCENSDLYMENIAVYFVYRHFAKYFEGIDISALGNFVLLSCYATAAMCNAKYEKMQTIDFADIIEYARMYSAEIEYSEDNTYALLDILA